MTMIRSIACPFVFCLGIFGSPLQAGKLSPLPVENPPRFLLRDDLFLGQCLHKKPGTNPDSDYIKAGQHNCTVPVEGGSWEDEGKAIFRHGSPSLIVGGYRRDLTGTDGARSLGNDLYKRIIEEREKTGPRNSEIIDVVHIFTPFSKEINRDDVRYNYYEEISHLSGGKFSINGIGISLTNNRQNAFALISRLGTHLVNKKFYGAIYHIQITINRQNMEMGSRLQELSISYHPVHYSEMLDELKSKIPYFNLDRRLTTLQSELEKMAIKSSLPGDEDDPVELREVLIKISDIKKVLNEIQENAVHELSEDHKFSSAFQPLAVSIVPHSELNHRDPLMGIEDATLLSYNKIYNRQSKFERKGKPFKTIF